jgi:demethylmenaquinone methyltransferase/2-methoxy-6-polyprenyl-1,4-benzoquinol methylase
MRAVESSMQAYYAARAREYDRVYDKPERQADLRVLQEWLPPLFRDSRLLEVACGTGYWTQFIAPQTRQIVAVDTSPETIAIAQSRVPRDKVFFLVADAYDLPRDQGPFDAAFAGFWLSHVPKKRQTDFLLGLSATVASGSTVVFVDNLYVEGSNQPISERDQEGNTYQLRTLDDGSVHRVLKNFPTETELRTLIEPFGHGIRFRRLDYYWAVQYVAGQP